MRVTTGLRLTLVSLATAALTASLITSAAAVPDKSADGPPVADADTSTEPVAVGLIVTTSRSATSPTEVARIASATGASRSEVAAIDARLMTVDFDEPVSQEQALAAAADLAGTPGVEHVEPNYLLPHAAAAPVRPNDPRFDELWGIWDRRDLGGIPDVQDWASGGFSVRAPSLWRATLGSPSTVVAVIDTGITAHPDLAANRVAGYDFASSGGDPYDRDGQSGWDADPSDPGDWATVGQCGITDPDDATASSWHGTHVAGTIAAVDGNRAGVVGVAPNVKIQPVRALGPCGGTTADIATAIKWAAGEPIPGVPTNKTPAKVINLSLGGQAPCGVTFQDAVSLARGLGSVVVAAAGNSNSRIGSPANCIGPVAVVATDEFGQRAGYSNVGFATASGGFPGRRADIAAPGGESSDGYREILSTYNTGTTVPGSPSYAELVGTSMAAPHVAGGAALLSSLGYDRRQIEAALKVAVRSVGGRNFPAYGQAAYDCVTSSAASPSSWDCGAGILDLGTVPALYGSRTISGTMKAGRTVSIGTLATGSVTPTYRWYRNGASISGATKKSYRLTSADRGKRITVKVTVAKQGFKTQTITSGARTVAR